MESVFSIIFVLLLLLGGNHGHTDLLDAISADVYWQLKHVTPELGQLQKDAASDPAPATIDVQVKALGSDDFATRDKARQDLERMGPAILPLVQPLTQSPDAEIAAVAQDLVKKFTEHAQERGIRRLMAIRTLGERKEKDALPLLTSLKDSQELFVPEYAARAIAQIKGEKWEPADPSAKFAGDLALLPADTAFVGQSLGLAAKPLTIATLVEAAAANDPMANLPPGALPPGAVVPPKPDTKQLIQQTSAQLLTVLERVGNIRIDGATMGFNYTTEVGKPAPAAPPAAQPDALPPDDAPPAGQPVEHGWVAVIIRGQFNSAAALAALKDLIGSDADITPAAKPGDVAIIAGKHGEGTVLIPNNQQVIFLAAPNDADRQAARDTFVAALKKGQGTFDQNQDLAALLKTVDRSAPLWAVGKFTDAMSKEILDGTFKTLTLTTKSQPDGGTDFTLKARTVDAEKAKAAMDSIGGDLKSALEDVKLEAKTEPRLASVADFLGSMKLSVEGAGGTMTGTLPAGILNSVIDELPLMELLTPRQQPQMIAPPQAVPAPPQVPVQPAIVPPGQPGATGPLVGPDNSPPLPTQTLTPAIAAPQAPAQIMDQDGLLTPPPAPPSGAPVAPVTPTVPLIPNQ